MKTLAQCFSHSVGGSPKGILGKDSFSCSGTRYKLVPVDKTRPEIPAS